MEKQEFSLSGVEERRHIIANGIFHVVIGGLGIWVFRNDRTVRWCWAVLVLLSFLIYLSRYLENKYRKLEVSDAGLGLISGSREIKRINWNTVRSVELRKEPAFWCFGSHCLSMKVIDLAGCCIRIPGTCIDAEKITDILKQRLPENVFQNR